MFFKHCLIMFTFIVIGIWVMPATSKDELDTLKRSCRSAHRFWYDDIRYTDNRISNNDGVYKVGVGKYNGNVSIIDNNFTQLMDIVGWKHTKNASLSTVLLELSLPYSDHTSCRKMYTTGYEDNVIDDKFFAGSASVSGQGTGVGYVGGGLSFFHTNSYYLTGVTSFKDPLTSLTVFTETKNRIKRIRELYNNHK